MAHFYAPEDLRTEDPRPAPPRDNEAAVVRELLIGRLTGDELTNALQALGLETYERGRHTDRAFTADEVCRNGHNRRLHASLDTNGWALCRKCDHDRRMAIRDREARKATA
jgi:hypothetical protein